MTKLLLGLIDDKFVKVCAPNSNESHPYLKSFGLGAAEGFIDSCVAIGAVVVVTGIVKTLISKVK